MMAIAVIPSENRPPPPMDSLGRRMLNRQHQDPVRHCGAEQARRGFLLNSALLTCFRTHRSHMGSLRTRVQKLMFGTRT